MAKFEELLLERLKQHEPDPGAALPPRRRRTSVLVAATAVLAAIAAIVLPSLGGNGSAAHAVTLNPDGTLTISIKDMADIDAANKELRDLGVTNIVIVAETEPGSCAPEDRPGPAVLEPDGLQSTPRDVGNVTTINRALIPPDRTLLLVADPRLFESENDDYTVLSGLVPTQARYCSDTLSTAPGTQLETTILPPTPSR